MSVSEAANPARDYEYSESNFYLHDLGVDLVQLGAFVALPAQLLVPGVLLSQRVQQLHDLRLSQQLLLHWTPSRA